MAAHSLSDQAAAQTIQLIEECLEEGFEPPWMNSKNGAIAEAKRRAVQKGITKTSSAFETRVRLARERGLEPDWSVWKAPVYQRPEYTQTTDAYPISPLTKPSGLPVRVCVIGDMHDDPRIEDKSRFEWIGRWCADEDPDYIVQLGDWATFDSVSKHAEKGSKAQRAQPTFMQDIESLQQSILMFEKGANAMGLLKAKKLFTTGNHEDRVSRYENASPDMIGALVPQWRNLLTNSGWRIYEYGEYAFIDGVGFTHHPVNGMGRAYGGKTGNQRAGNDSIFSIVHGHDHKLERVSSSKIGPFRAVDIISAGCALPWGWVEPYAKLSPAGWWWGVMALTIHEGSITDMDTVSMLRLEERYGY